MRILPSRIPRRASPSARHPFLSWVACILIAALCTWLAPADAGASQGEVMRVATRPGVTVPLFTAWRPDAVATLVLFSGGAGGYGKLGDDGWPGSGNFLIRTGKLWASQPFNLVMVGRPSDGIDLGEGAIRVGAEHLADNMALLAAVRARNPAPIWLVGTSMGTISAAATAIADEAGIVSGLVLTSSVTGFRVRGAVPTQDLGRIKAPTLVIHHAKDACRICAPHEARDIAAKLVSAPIKRTVMVEGGSGETGNPCEAFHFHGFIGFEREVVDLIANWIRQPSN